MYLYFFITKTAGVFPFIALFRLTSEASTPFINIRSMMLTLKLSHTKLYLLNGVITLVVFFFVRVFTIIPNWAIFFSLMNTPEWYSIVLKYKVICVVSCVPLDCLNVYWFGKMIKLACRHVQSKPPSKIDDTDLKLSSLEKEN